MTMLCSLLTVCFVSAQISRQEGTDGQAAIYRLSLFERAVRCTKYFEGWHSEKHHPYVGWGHKILPGERYSARTMTKRQAEIFKNLTGKNFQGREYADYIRHIAIGSMGFTPGSIEFCRDGDVIDTGTIPNV